MKTNKKCKALVLTALANLALGAHSYGQSADALINKLVEKGILTEKEGKDLLVETAPSTNLVSALKNITSYVTFWAIAPWVS